MAAVLRDIRGRVEAVLDGDDRDGGGRLMPGVKKWGEKAAVSMGRCGWGGWAAVVRGRW